MALLIVLLALFLVSAIGMGMIYMSTTETSINANYRDTQQAFFAMRGGLEEMRDRMRKNAPSPITLPTAMPNSGLSGSVVYITNPAGLSDTISPTTYGTTYFDDEFCHESFTTITLSVPANIATPCGSGGAVPSAAVTTFSSVMPFTNTSSSLKYKWVRITLKQNGTITNAMVNSTQPASGQACWDSANSREIVPTSLNAAYTTCALAQNAGFNVNPVYLITSFAYTPQGTRRIGQYEVAAINITPPPAALAMGGPGASFPTAPNSNNLTINGNNTGTAGYAGPGTCTQTTPTQVPAVSTGDMTGQTTVAGNIPPVRDGNYTGTAPTAPAGAVPPAIPSVVDEGTDTGGSGQLSGVWNSPQQLNNLVALIANSADVQLTCPIGTPCTGSYGTDANPQITYVNGDLNLTGGAGLLVVTGTLTASGHPSFDGLIMVIGQGIMSFSGGGSGQLNGSIFIANTNSRTSPYAQLATLGSPQMSWNGGGTNAIQFNSCWANLENDLHFAVVSSREEMY